jgi:hypothetical protein
MGEFYPSDEPFPVRNPQSTCDQEVWIGASGPGVDVQLHVLHFPVAIVCTVRGEADP